ncbi:MAG: ATP-binding protein, partial [Bacteroidota bacterium]|nr:ATP-binding protein [Bacteroidota bacterium]
LVDSFCPMAEEKGITLQYVTQVEEAEYLFDADKWSKIVNNLLSNAIKFTPTGGRVAVNLKQLETPGQNAASQQLLKQVQLIVEDTGIGIPADKQEHIFDRFYQVDNSQTRSFEGTGIGLSLVKELVDLLQGQIILTSQPGTGTTFIVVLPILKAALDDSTPLAQVPELVASLPAMENFTDNLQENQNRLNPNPEAPLILVVEDNKDLREFMVNELAGTYRVLTATNGEEGWQLTKQELPEVVISDIMMPVMDGYTLTEHIKTNVATNHIAIILLTAKAAQESKVTGLGLGADDYLTKPFHLPELKLRLRNLLDHQQKLRQYYQQQLSSPEVVSPMESVQDKFLQMLYQVLEDQLDNSKFDVDELADATAMSRRTLHRKITALTGLTPLEVIRNYRLKRASQFLLAGHAVSETAYLVGFESPSNFGHWFKEKYQVTPSEYLHQYVAKTKQ